MDTGMELFESIYLPSALAKYISDNWIWPTMGHPWAATWLCLCSWGSPIPTDESYVALKLMMMDKPIVLYHFFYLTGLIDINRMCLKNKWTSTHKVAVLVDFSKWCYWGFVLVIIGIMFSIGPLQRIVHCFSVRFWWSFGVLNYNQFYSEWNLAWIKRWWFEVLISSVWKSKVLDDDRSIKSSGIFLRMQEHFDRSSEIWEVVGKVLIDRELKNV